MAYCAVQEQPFDNSWEMQLISHLSQFGLTVAPGKVKRTFPMLNLGWKLSDAMICPQTVELKIDISTLTDLQTLLGRLQWLRPTVGISNVQLELLLSRGRCANDAILLMPEAKQALIQITAQIQSAASYCQSLHHNISLVLYVQEKHAVTVICQ